MQVKGHTKFIEFGQNGFVLRVIQKGVSWTPKQQCADEAKFLDGAFEFFGRSFRLTPGQRRKSTEA